MSDTLAGDQRNFIKMRLRSKDKLFGFYFIGLLFFVLLFLFSCKKFEYNPYQSTKPDRPEELNATNLDKLLSAEDSGDDTITILFTGDSQRFYRSLDLLVEKTNSIASVDFLIMAGDISDFGLLEEFTWINERLQKLKVPYFCAIGNHDHTANGSQIYTEMFGPKNYSFKYKGYKFIIHDTNGRESNYSGNVPDMPWLTGQFNDPDASWFVGVSHMPPYDSDFDPDLEEPYRNLLASKKGFVAALSGHSHHEGDSFYYNDGVRYISTPAVGRNVCTLLKLIDGKVLKSIIFY